MARSWSALPVGTSTGVEESPGSYIDPFETIGRVDDAVASDIDDANSFFSLLKAIAAGFGVSVPAQGAVLVTNPRLDFDPLVTLGHMEDAPAADMGSHSLISLLKGIASNLGVPT